MKNSLKTKILALTSLFSFSLIFTTGIDGDTVITTSSGRLKPIRELKVGDEVVCYNKDMQQESSTINGIATYTADKSMEITTTDNIVLSTSLTERFFLPKEQQWVCAKDLKVGDCFLNEDFDLVAVTNIQQDQLPKKMFIITVDKHHNFLASQGKYIVHNGPVAGFIGYWIVKGGAYLGLAAAPVIVMATTPVSGPVAGALAAAGSTALSTTSIGTAAGIAAGAAAGSGTLGVGIAASIQATAVFVATQATIESAAVGTFCFLTTCPLLP